MPVAPLRPRDLMKTRPYRLDGVHAPSSIRPSGMTGSDSGNSLAAAYPLEALAKRNSAFPPEA